MTFEYSPDIEQSPGHLSAEFFLEVLDHSLRNSRATVGKVQMTMGSATGENYCSQIYRTRIHYSLDGQERSLSVIVKSMPISQANEFLQDLEVFLKEKIFYNDVLPRLELFLEGGQKFGARLYHSMKLPINTLVFEDLSTRGFQVASRESGLNEEHCRLVMRKLGKFHASSMVLAKKDPEIMKSFGTGILAKEGLIGDSMLGKYFTGNAEALSELVHTWPGFESIAESIDKYRANLLENLSRSQAPLPGELRVLNHGDLWVNNILFKYAEAKGGPPRPVDLVLVDYQMTVWGSPGIDLNYFFYTSLEFEVLKGRRGALIREYHESLRTMLTELRHPDIPSLQDIQREVRQRESYGFFAHFGIFPTISMDKEQSGDNKLDNYMDEEFARKKVRQMFESKRLAETMKYTLKAFQALGIWD